MTDLLEITNNNNNNNESNKYEHKCAKNNTQKLSDNSNIIKKDYNIGTANKEKSKVV